MNIDVDEPVLASIPGVANRALVRVNGDSAEVAIATSELLTRRRLTGTEITMMDAKWLVGAVVTTTATTSFACRRTDNGR